MDNRIMKNKYNRKTIELVNRANYGVNRAIEYLSYYMTALILKNTTYSDYLANIFEELNKAKESLKELREILSMEENEQTEE